MQNRSKSLKVLHVIPSVAPCRGGPSQAVIDMVSALRMAGVNAEIATTNDDGPNKLDVPLNALIDYQGVPVRFFNRLTPPISALSEFAIAPSFTRWFRRHAHDYDLIHVHAIFSYCSTRAMQIARNKNVPYMVRPIGQLEKWSLQQSKLRKQHYLKWFERANLEQAACVQFTAESEQQQASELLPKLTSTVIPLGLDIPIKVSEARTKLVRRWELKREIPIILFLSRLHPKKGLEPLLAALGQIHDLPFQFVIAGDGEPSYVLSLKNLSVKHGIEDQCLFIGFTRGTEKTLLLQGADLFVLTSFSENFGIAALESMASGTTVLLSTEVALAKVVKEHELGWITELDSQQIKTKLIEALSDLDTVDDRGDRARHYVEQHFQWKNIVQQLIRRYQRIIK